MSRDLVLLCLSLVTWGIGEGMFFYFQPLYLEQLGADPILTGLILGGYGVAMTVTHIPAGYLADRFGRKPVLTAAWLIGAVSGWIMALARSLPVFVMGMLIYGTTMFVMAPMNSYATAARGRLSVGRVITLVSASFNLGAVVGPWLGGQIGDQVGLQRTYLIAAVLFMISTLVILLIRAQPVEPRLAEAEGQALWRNSRYVAFLGVVLLTMFAMSLPQALAPNFLQNQRGLRLSQIGTLYTVSGAGIVSLNLLLGQLPVRLGFVLSQLAVGAFAGVLWQASGLGWYAAAYFLLGGYKVARSLSSAQVRDLVRPREMGLAFGVVETVAGAALVLAPPLAGYLYDRDPAWMFGAGVALLAAAVIAGLGYFRSLDRGQLGGARLPLGPERRLGKQPRPTRGR